MRVALLLLLLADIALAAGDRKEDPAAVYHARDAQIQALQKRVASSNLQVFAPEIFRGASGARMPYRFFKPKVPPGQKLPLVLVFHGAGARGNDNVKQLGGLGAGLWTLPENQKKHPCFVLAPQSAASPGAWIRAGDWEDFSHPLRDEPTPELALAMELLDQICRDNPIDPDRIYILGHSMGGYATWDAIVRWPARFAAAAPASAGMADNQAPKIAKLPIWIFHGNADETEPFPWSQRAYDELVAAGASPRFTVYEAAGHGIGSYAWTEPGFADWLFAQKRGAAPGPKVDPNWPFKK